MNYLEIGGRIVGVMAFILMIVFYIKSRKEKKPCWTYRNDFVIGKGNQGAKDIKILFENKEVTRVTSTKIFLWNRGREVIKNQDIPNSDPLRLIFPKGIEILRTNLLKKSRESIDFGMSEESTSQENILKYKFSFLDHNDGLVMEVIHNGDEKVRIKNVGTILGAKKGFKLLEYEEDLPYEKILPIFGFLAFMILGTLIVIGFLAKSFLYIKFIQAIEFSGGVFAGMVSSLGYKYVVSKIARFPKELQIKPQLSHKKKK
jgi:hypothetical protein